MAENLEIFIKSIIEQTKVVKKAEGVPFPVIIKHATGNTVIPAEGKKIEKQIEILRKCFDEFVSSSKLKPFKANSVNLLGKKLPPKLKKLIKSKTNFSCSTPLTAVGKRQVVGYPNLVVQSENTCIYLHVKAFSKSPKSYGSLRSFYYEPKQDTNKINKDGFHLLIGFECTKKDNADQKFYFVDWKLVDLAKLKILFKGEFYSNNKTMYDPGTVITKMRKNYLKAFEL